MIGDLLEYIKASLPIATAWRLLGLSGIPAKECRSPFRPDRRPSFSIFKAEGWERWYDHGSGESGDVVDLWAKARNFTIREAINDIITTVPAVVPDPGGFEAPKAQPTRPPEQNAPESIHWPCDLRAPTAAECRALGALRSIDPAAFDIAGRLGTLKVATLFREKHWFITDSNRRCAEARRFDGELFTFQGREMKSFALPGSHKDWPLGMRTNNSHYDALENILLVEGMPDYYAGLALALNSEINFRPLTMLGAGIQISDEVAAQFRGANVIIVPHNDTEGEKFLQARTAQFHAFDAAKVIAQKLPFEHNDLNDVLTFSPSEALQVLKGFNDISAARNNRK